MRRAEQGFTLIELILVILVLSIVSISVTSFISFGVSSYQDVSGRAKQIGDSRFLIERLTREIRDALPNSVRVTNGGECVEFIPILASLSYVDIPVLPDEPSSNIEVVTSDEEFAAVNTKVVVYPLSPSDVYVMNGLTEGKLFTVDKYLPVFNPNQVTSTIKLDDEVLFDEDSPTQRYFIIRDSVAYCQDAENTIKRYQGHDFTVAQATTPEGTGILMAERQINDSPFSLQSPTLVRNAIVIMDFTFSYTDENLRLVNKVHISNVP